MRVEPSRVVTLTSERMSLCYTCPSSSSFNECAIGLQAPTSACAHDVPSYPYRHPPLRAEDGTTLSRRAFSPDRRSRRTRPPPYPAGHSPAQALGFPGGEAARGGGRGHRVQAVRPSRWRASQPAHHRLSLLRQQKSLRRLDLQG